MEHWWNNNDGGKPKHSEKKNCHSATSPTTNAMWTGMGLNLGLNGDGQQLTACAMA